jgi:hypothetical protein
MKKLSLLTVLLAATFGLVSTTQAQVLVTYDPNALESNFGDPTGSNDNVAYTVALTSDATNIYVNVVADPAAGGALNGLDFTNLYFSTDLADGGHSTIGFESGGDAFIPGGAGPVSVAGTGVTGTDSGGDWTITIPWAYLETDPSGLGFDKIGGENDTVRLNLSQSFGYSVAGGTDAFGPTEFGEVATPEPASWTMALGAALIFGFFYRRSRMTV